MRKYQSKKCSACKRKYTPTSGKQHRCSDCIASGRRSTKPPKCKCGCKQKTKWSTKYQGWNEYVLGHHARINNPNKGGRTPWNKGNVTRYQHTCGRCGKGFENAFKVATYCSPECYHREISGPNHHFWKGDRTKYRFTADGKREHRVVMGRMVGRELLATEVVHHMDENGHNNDPPNLHLFHCESCHQHYHKKKRVGLRYVFPTVHAAAMNAA